MNQFFFTYGGTSSKAKKSPNRNKKGKPANAQEVTGFVITGSPLSAFPAAPQARVIEADEEEEIKHQSTRRTRRTRGEPDTNPPQSQPYATRQLYVPFIEFWNSVRSSSPFMHGQSSLQLLGSAQPAMAPQPPDNTAVHFAVHDYTTTSPQAPNGLKYVISCSLGDVHQVANWVAPVNSGRRLVVRGVSGHARSGFELAALVRDGLTSLSLEIIRDEAQEPLQDHWAD